MSQDTATPSLPEAVRRRVACHLRELRVALPGRVESYDEATGRATVQPLVKDGYFDELGERQVDRLPAVADVPIVFQGAGDYQVDFPIAVGDEVLLVFSSSSIDRWLATGGEVDPGDDRRHALSDAVAIPGLRSRAYGGPANKRIKFTASTIEVGGSSSLALEADFAALKSFVHGLATGGTGSAIVPDGHTYLGGTNVLKGA